MSSVRAQIFHRVNCVVNSEQSHLDVPDLDGQTPMFGNLFESRDA